MRQCCVTQRDTASAIGISPQLLGNKLHGRANYTLRDLSRLADYFDVSIDYLTGRSDIKQPMEVK
ncbi:XRE family transcriptional regulator [Bifidobacterium callitrichidarum]|uniref:XRE family transcriptional regulator n=2 Tax=Bifidobacterium callitrichidarum TaxID=2052941 RepID=A0A2U2N7Q8_9BIFI|nr:XRE family transcriptional regulator [Bifidobacterium callitrichidarum]